MEKYSTQLETLQNVAIETDELISDVVKSQKLTSRGKNEKSLYLNTVFHLLNMERRFEQIF